MPRRSTAAETNDPKRGNKATPDGQALPPVNDAPIKDIHSLTLLSIKRTYDLFSGTQGHRIPLDEESHKSKIACKINDEYAQLTGFKPCHVTSKPSPQDSSEPKSETAKLIDTLPVQHRATQRQKQGQQLVLHSAAGGGGGGRGHELGITAEAKAALVNTVMIPTAAGGEKEYLPSASMAKRMAAKWPRPQWRSPWKNYRVISGHQGWVRCIDVDPSNEWFATGAGDRTIKIWELASGNLKLTLTGHIEQVMGLTISQKHPYMYSCGLDKQVKCWDLEVNKVIRNYYGHLSGVYSIAQHPILDVLATGGRDGTCRVWDMRTRTQVMCLEGHEDTVASILTQGTDPQIITGSYDKMIKLWDLRKGKALSTLTYHKKGVRALVAHPTEHTFASGAADNIKKYGLPTGEFLHNFLDQQRAIVNCLAVNEDGAAVSGGDNGSLWFWDWKSGHCFQKGESIPQPGSLDAENGIYAMKFDVTGSRLITCEADKTIKMWKEDEMATPETHPLDFRPPKDVRRF